MLHRSLVRTDLGCHHWLECFREWSRGLQALGKAQLQWADSGLRCRAL